MAKTHFAGALWPIRFDGRDVKALCGKIVPKAVLVFVWDELPMGERLENLNRLANCEDCIDEVPKANITYLYSCIPAQIQSDEAKTK